MNRELAYRIKKIIWIITFCMVLAGCNESDETASSPLDEDFVVNKVLVYGEYQFSIPEYFFYYPGVEEEHYVEYIYADQQDYMRMVVMAQDKIQLAEEDVEYTTENLDEDVYWREHTIEYNSTVEFQENTLSLYGRQMDYPELEMCIIIEGTRESIVESLAEDLTQQVKEKVMDK